VVGLAHRLGGIRFHLLVNNAGILTRESLEDMDFERMRQQFEVNALGPLRLTCALLPNLGHGSKVILITSRMGSLGDNTSGSRYGYRMSKAALNIAGISLAHDLKERGIAVAILHPGFVRTGMTQYKGYVDPPESAAGLISRIEELTLETSGGFWHANGERLPW
jgi:NAD(P)-dependent dehydrogenase (short-subunit alcohol dehydrogenase family)